MQNTKDSSPLPPTSFETSKEKEDVKPNTLEIYPPDSEKGKLRKAVRLSDCKVFTISDYNQKFYHIDRKSFLNEHYTFSEIQKFIDQGLFSKMY